MVGNSHTTRQPFQETWLCRILLHTGSCTKTSGGPHPEKMPLGGSIPENHSVLFCSALLERNHLLACKIMYLLVPLLNRGNDKHKLTSAGFFVELLQSPVARRLPSIYSISRLEDWLHHGNNLFKMLALRGLCNLVRHWEMREDIKRLLPSILDSLCETDERIVLLAIQILQKLVRMMDFTTLAAMLRILFSLFGDVSQREKILP